MIAMSFYYWHDVFAWSLIAAQAVAITWLAGDRHSLREMNRLHEANWRLFRRTMREWCADGTARSDESPEGAVCREGKTRREVECPDKPTYWRTGDGGKATGTPRETLE